MGSLQRSSNNWWALVDRNHASAIRCNVGLAIDAYDAYFSEAYVTQGNVALLLMQAYIFTARRIGNA